MRIVIDMQGAQATNRFRGIGRYSLAFAQALARNRGEHEIILALSDLFPDTIEPIRAAFDGLLPEEDVRVWRAVPPVAQIHSDNNWRRHVAELTREAFLASLDPDIVHVSSLFEGLVDDGVTSIGRLPKGYLTSVTLYDLIPYIYRKPYLENPIVESWYFDKIEHLRRADLLLAISESSRHEGISCLDWPENRIVNVSTATDPQFQKVELSEKQKSLVRKRYALSKPFVMYTGGIDHRKNIEGLIRAYAKLPRNLRSRYQLAIVCSIQPDEKKRLIELAKMYGLNERDVLLTGFVPEEDLIALYNLCTLFVFPSWHEGFGLPVLEAMRCGAAVIGANSSSLPEVIGLQDALFAPRDDDAMARLIERALSDEKFLANLKKNGSIQAQKFSWDKTATRALDAMEEAVSSGRQSIYVAKRVRPKLAYLSPLPPEQSGISDYSAELLPYLSRYYLVDVVVEQEQVTDPWIKKNCMIRSIEQFRENADRYDRLLYHFGNSKFHKHMFPLLHDYPGVIVLHDFFLSGVVHWMDATGYSKDSFEKALYKSHGYAGLIAISQTQDVGDVIWKYPCNLDVLQNALGIIVHSLYSRQLAQQWYSVTDAHKWAIIPHLRVAAESIERRLARQALGLSQDDFVVCSFGILGPAKLNQRLLQAWMNSPLASDAKCKLVFVGEASSDYGKQILSAVRSNPRILVTGWVSTETFRHYLAAADIAVQLRSLSRGETSGTVLDCMNYGIATIVNAHGSLAEVDSGAMWVLPDDFSNEQLVDALTQLWHDSKMRKNYGERARHIIRTNHDPAKCAEMFHHAIETFYENAPGRSFKPIVDAISALQVHRPDDKEIAKIASALALSMPPRPRQRQLLVDVSELVQRDVHTGIQRVVRSVLNEWLRNPPEGYRVEPIYATLEHDYRYARRFTRQFLGLKTEELPDDPIDYAPGDVFFGLDLQPQVQTAHRQFYQELRRIDIKTYFMVYDLLPVVKPDFFLTGAADDFIPWLKTVAESDGVVCISKAIAQDFESWVKSQSVMTRRGFTVSWTHLGADTENSVPTTGLPPDAHEILASLRARPSFLMVGTLEPRKGHAQVLDAFDRLWQEGVNVNLAIVGKQGWMVEDLVERLRHHTELNRRLFWLEGISDEYLEKVYAVSACLIAASYGEGFGLPLIEAAQHKLPIIARDIPVFREVADEHAFYFEAENPDLVRTIKSWLYQYDHDRHPKSFAIPSLTWSECAENILKIILKSTLRN